MTTTFDWSEVAPAWEAHREQARESVADVTRAVLDRLQLQAGERVLELGSGTGHLARVLAEQVGPSGQVLATDVAEGMVAVATRTLADVPHASVARVDAAATGLPDAAHDAAVFVMGLMFVPAPERAAQELRRVLVPGRRAVVATWAGPEHNPWLASLGFAAMVHGLVAGGPPTEPGGLFSLAEPARLEEVLRAGGFADVEVDEVPVSMRYDDADAWFESVSALAGPLAAALAARPDLQDAVRATAVEAVQRFTTDDGVVLPGLALVARASG